MMTLRLFGRSAVHVVAWSGFVLVTTGCGIQGFLDECKPAADDPVTCKTCLRSLEAARKRDER